jgi:hypothetical protein
MQFSATTTLSSGFDTILGIFRLVEDAFQHCSMAQRLPECCPDGIARYMLVAIKGVKRAQNFFNEEEY